MNTPPANKDEMTALNLADDYAEEAAASLGLAKSADLAKLTEGARAMAAAMCATADALLALGARVDRLCEILNRELPDIGAAIVDARDAD